MIKTILTTSLLSKAAYENLKSSKPAIQICYKSHFEQTMVWKFMSSLCSDYNVAKARMLTGSELSRLTEAYSRPNPPILTQPATETLTSALAATGEHGQGPRRGSG